MSYRSVTVVGINIPKFNTGLARQQERLIRISEFETGSNYSYTTIKLLGDQNGTMANSQLSNYGEIMDYNTTETFFRHLPSMCVCTCESSLESKFKQNTQEEPFPGGQQWERDDLAAIVIR